MSDIRHLPKEIQTIRAVSNPDKLRHLGTVAVAMICTRSTMAARLRSLAAMVAKGRLASWNTEDWVGE